MIYKDITNQKDEPSHTSSKGSDMFTFGTILSVIAGLILQSALYVVLGIDVDNVPVLVIIILWIVFSTIAAETIDKIGL